MCGNDTQTKDLGLPAWMSVCLCVCPQRCVWVHWLYNNQLQSAESNVTFFYSLQIFNVSHWWSHFVSLNTWSRKVSPLLTLGSLPWTHKSINSQTHIRTNECCSLWIHKHIQLYMQRKWRTEIVQLCENWREKNSLCELVRQEINSPTMLKQTRFSFGTGTLYFPVLQFVVPLFTDCNYGFNNVVALVCNLNLGPLLLKKGTRDSNHMFSS